MTKNIFDPTETNNDSKPNGIAYCAIIKYPGLKPMIWGTVFCPKEFQDHEILTAIAFKVDEILPKGYRIVNFIRGQMVFIEG